MKKIKNVLMPLREFRGESPIMLTFREGLNWVHAIFCCVTLLASLVLTIDQLFSDQPYFFSEGFMYTIYFVYTLVHIFIVYLVLYFFYRSIRKQQVREWQDLVKKFS